MSIQYVTLEDFRQGRANLTPQHLESLKLFLGNGLRAQWKKDRLARLDLSTLRLIPPHWSFQRILFYPNGRAEYVTGQDYNYEIAQVRDAILGKK